MAITNYGGLTVVNTTTTGNQYQATAAGLATGKILVTWYDNGLKNVRAQFFDAHGNRIGAEFFPSLGGVGSAGNYLPRVSADIDGGYTIAYITLNTAGSIIGNIADDSFDANGRGRSGGQSFTGGNTYNVVKTRGNFQAYAYTTQDNGGDVNSFNGTVSTSTAGLQNCPDVAFLSSTKYVVSWWDDATKQVKARIYGAVGNTISPLTGEIAVGSVGTATQSEAFGYRGQAVASLSNGSFVVTWNSLGASASDTSGHGIQAAIYTSTGVLVKGTFQLNTTTTSSQLYPAVVGTLDGGFAVAWSDFSVGGSSSRTVLRTYDASGNATSDEYYVDGAGHFDYQPQLTLLADGRIAVTWEADQTVPQDISGWHVEMQIVDTRSSAVYLTSIAAGSDFVGTNFADSFTGSGGNDTFDGGAGNDVLIGGGGVNILTGGGGYDRAIYNIASSAVTITHNSNGSTTIAGTGIFDVLTGVETAVFNDKSVSIAERTRSDFNGNGGSDLVLQSGGSVYDWILNAGVFQSGQIVGSYVPGWSVVGTGDFNGDGVTDLLLKNGGSIVAWTMQNGVVTGSSFVGGGVDGWTVVGTGDFNGDGTTDIALQNGGTVVDWIVQNGTVSQGNVVGSYVPGWNVVGTGDFNGDGNSDLLLKNGGTVVAWNMQNGLVTGGGIVGYGVDAWDVVGTGDFNNDGTTDILLKSGGTIYDWIVQNNSVIAGNLLATNPGLAGFNAFATGDYNGDGTTDIALQGGSDLYNWTIKNGQLISSALVGSTGGFTLKA